jgi:hypothetical protein
MKSMRSKAMIAAAMSAVRLILPTGRRRAIAARVSLVASAATDCQLGVSSQPDETTLTRGASSTVGTAAPMSYSLIGW